MNRHFVLMCAAVLLLAGSASRGAILLQDNFDSYTTTAEFEAGAASTPPGAWTPTGTSGVLSTAQAFGGSGNSILIGTAAGRNTHALAADTAPTAAENIEFSFRFYVTDTAQGRQQADIIDAAGTGQGQIIGMGTNNNVSSSEFFWRVGGIDADGTGPIASGAYAPMDAGAPNRTVGWHELKAVIRRDSATLASADFYVDGILGKTVTGFSLRSFENMRLGGNQSSVNSAFFDDVLVQTVPVPEPAALGLLAAAAVGFIGRRRRA